MQFDYWQKQDFPKPLFPDILWNKPEQKSLAGRLGIVGGNQFGFTAVNTAFRVAQKQGVGEVKILVPESLKKIIPPTLIDVHFAKNNPSGGFSKEAKPSLEALERWANGLLFIGDNGKNTETASVFEEFILDSETQITIARDSVDLLMTGMEQILDKPNIVIVASFAQLQKIFRQVYYPKMLTFSMQLMQFIETLHKFSITFEATIVTFHQDNIIISKNGQIISQKFNQPLRIWQGEIPTAMASYLLWSPSKQLEALATSLIPDWFLVYFML